MQWVVAIVLVVTVAAAYVTWLAARLDRLAARCEAGAAALEAALARLEVTGQLPDDHGDKHAQTQNRVDLARAFHQDALRDDRALRNRISVRALGLSRRHPVSAYAYLDNATPSPSSPSDPSKPSNWSS